MKTLIPVENGNTVAALQDLLRRLLQSDRLDALMVPMKTSVGTVAPTLVTDPGLLEQADPLAPVFPLNSARILGWMTQHEPRGRIGAVMRSCEMRAMVELVKLKQACLDCVTLISIDCAGTYDVPVYKEKSSQGEELWHQLYAEPLAEVTDLRDACQMCEQPVYDEADVVIELIGGDLSKGLSVDLSDELATTLGLSESSGASSRAETVEKLVAQRTERRDAIFAEMRGQLDGGRAGAGMEDVFSACIRCHNCMTVCPICYCKTCLFRGPVFDHEPIQYMRWATHKGALRLPSDTTLFHLTRLNHMALSCVGCGMCTSVCPADIPVGRVFRTVGASVQAVFDYVPGFNPEEMLPLVAFKEEEWQEVGE
jgi:formate dehydrogenase subunit beta